MWDNVFRTPTISLNCVPRSIFRQIMNNSRATRRRLNDTELIKEVGECELWTLHLSDRIYLAFSTTEKTRSLRGVSGRFATLRNTGNVKNSTRRALDVPH